MNRPRSNRLPGISLVLLLLAFPASLSALSTDKDQDIEIESDSAYLDDTSNVSVYSGNVVVVQGSMRITGDKMTIYYTSGSELDRIIMEGQPATFRQLPDNSSVHDEAEALVMEYYEQRNLIVLSKQARVKQGDRRLIADHVEYDTGLSQVRATSNNAEPAPAGSGTDTRVKLIIPARKPADESAN